MTDLLAVCAVCTYRIGCGCKHTREQAGSPGKPSGSERELREVRTRAACFLLQKSQGICRALGYRYAYACLSKLGHFRMGAPIRCTGSAPVLALILRSSTVTVDIIAVSGGWVNLCCRHHKTTVASSVIGSWQARPRPRSRQACRTQRSQLVSFACSLKWTRTALSSGCC